MFLFFFNPFLLGYFILPASLFALAVGFYKYRQKELSVNQKAKKTAFVSAVLVFVVYTAYTIYLISISTNSTAILGVIEIPFSGIPLALFAYAIEWSLAYLFFSKVTKESYTGENHSRRIIIAAVVVALVVILGSVESYRTALAMKVSNSTKAGEIQKVYDSFFVKYDDKILSQIASNEYTPVEVLNELAHDDRERVLHEVARNPATPLEALRFMYENQGSERFGDRYVAYDLAVNPSTPLDILLELSKSDDDVVRSNSTYNPNLPLEILCELSKEQKGVVSSQAKSNIKARGVACP